MASVLLLAVVLFPLAEVFKNEPADAFPLSYYPMFSRKRGDDLAVTHPVGITAAGERRRVPYTYASPGGMNTARKQMRRLVLAGAAAELCGEVAARVAGQSAELADVTEIQIVTGFYEYERHFRGETMPAHERVHASCQVRR